MSTQTGKSNPASRLPIETRFKPGVSGNPAGRPKKALQIAEKAQDHAEEALRAMIDLLKSADERVKLQAAQAILDRGLGKPKQTIEDNRKSEVTDYTVDELRTLAGMGSERTAAPQAGARESDRLQ